MLMSPKFKAITKENGTVELLRSGIATAVVIPEDLKKRISYEASVVDNKVVFNVGEGVYIIADEFGFIGGAETEVETNIFFIDGGIVFELLSGRMALKGDNDEIYIVDETGDIDYPNGHTRINWKKSSDILGITTSVVKHRYSTSEELTQSYINNLVINVVFHNQSTAQGYVFNVKFKEYFEDLGLGAFQFINYGENIYVADEDTHDTSDLVDVDDDEEDEEDDDHAYKMDGEEEDDLTDKF
jgi:hypothetical protein